MYKVFLVGRVYFFFEKVNYIQSLNTKYRDGAKIVPFKVFQSHLVRTVSTVSRMRLRFTREQARARNVNWQGLLVLRSHWTDWHLAGHSAYVYMSL